MVAPTPIQLEAERQRNRELLIGFGAGGLGIVLATLMAILVVIITLVTAIGSYIREEPELAPPIEWRSTVQTDGWPGEDDPVFIRLERDGSASVERFPIAPGPEGPFAEWAGSCFDPRYASTYTGPASWRPHIGGTIEIEVLGSQSTLSAATFFLRHDWATPKVFGCDEIFDIDLEIVCGDPGNARPEGWIPCEPERQ